MREKIKEFFRKVGERISQTPAYAKFLKVRDKVANRILNALLVFFNAIAPCWTFLCVKTPKATNDIS